MTAIAPTMQAFFTDRLMNQLHASPHTIASYRDTMRLVLAYASQQHGKEPCKLDFTDLDAPAVGAFLTHLETTRGNGVTTRNARLVAIHSLFRYASLHVPEHAELISRVLAPLPRPVSRCWRNPVISTWSSWAIRIFDGAVLVACWA